LKTSSLSWLFSVQDSKMLVSFKAEPADKRNGRGPSPLLLVAIGAVNVMGFVIFRTLNPNVSFRWRTQSVASRDMNKLHSEHVRASMQADWTARCKQDKTFFTVDQGRVSLLNSYISKLTKLCEGKSSGLIVR
jgi:hypothetical protein